MNVKCFAQIIALHHETPPRLRRSRSPCAAALTRSAPSAIVRASLITRRTTARTTHARRLAHIATPAVAFISQVPPFAR